jgi:transposase
MTKLLISDTLWAIIAPLLPPELPKPRGGRPRIPDRAALMGILCVLKSGIPFARLCPTLLASTQSMTFFRRSMWWTEMAWVARYVMTSAVDSDPNYFP